MILKSRFHLSAVTVCNKNGLKFRGLQPGDGISQTLSEKELKVTPDYCECVMS